MILHCIVEATVRHNVSSFATMRLDERDCLAVSWSKVAMGEGSSSNKMNLQNEIGEQEEMYMKYEDESTGWCNVMRR